MADYGSTRFMKTPHRFNARSGIFVGRQKGGKRQQKGERPIPDAVVVQPLQVVQRFPYVPQHAQDSVCTEAFMASK
jgi:hypothetical protein